MSYPPCMHLPGPWGKCFDLGCSRQGGRCVYLGGRRSNAICACRAVEPSRNVVVREILTMETGLKLCRDFLSKHQPANSESLFAERIRRLREGDELAGPEISGSYLETVLEFVEALPVLPRDLNLLDAFQEANVGLVDAIESFTGSTREEFWEHAQQTILAWLNSSDEQV